MVKIPFNKPYLTGGELANIRKAHHEGHLSGDGSFTEKCRSWFEHNTGCCKAMLTHSCTAALEMTAILADILPGDEVIMPSYTFVSTANAFVLRGGVPVFVDIREDTLNLDEQLLERAVTPKTKAIVPVHYAGIGCRMDRIMSFAAEHGLTVIEDAAQGICSTYQDKPLGSIAQMGCLSFHETKNVISGEGGALLINDERLVERADIIREKGTNRTQFKMGLTDKYTWCDIGSSFLPSDIIAAFLYAQLENAVDITARRVALWDYYHRIFEDLEQEGLLRRPHVPADCTNNAHMYYLLFASERVRNRVMQYQNEHGINSVFHYVPLHSSPAGQRYGRVATDMRVTDKVSGTLLRLPLWIGMTPEMQDDVKASVAVSVRSG